MKYLYILSVVIDDTIRDDRDASKFGASGFFNDGFEFFLDTKGDSTDCISDDGFPNVDKAEPNGDDFQVTVGLNANFKPVGSSANVLGARQAIERGGNPDLVGPLGEDKAGPGGIYRDVLAAIGGPDIAARKFDDLRAAGARNPELAAKPNTKFSGYVIEMRIPLGNRIPNMTADHSMGFEIFWRDVDTDEDPGKGGGNISWASWGQSTTVDCGNPQTSLFNSANWGHLVFDTSNPLAPAGAIDIRSAKVDGANLTLTWTGGTAPFQVQRRNEIASGAWTNAGAPTNDRTTTVPRTGDPGFFRISGN